MNEEGTITTIRRLEEELFAIVEGDADEKTKVKSYGLVREMVSLIKDQRLELADLTRVLVIPRTVWTPLRSCQFTCYCVLCRRTFQPGSFVWIGNAVDPTTGQAANRYICNTCWMEGENLVEPQLPFAEAEA